MQKEKLRKVKWIMESVLSKILVQQLLALLKCCLRHGDSHLNSVTVPQFIQAKLLGVTESRLRTTHTHTVFCATHGFMNSAKCTRKRTPVAVCELTCTKTPLFQTSRKNSYVRPLCYPYINWCWFVCPGVGSLNHQLTRGLNVQH